MFVGEQVESVATGFDYTTSPLWVHDEEVGLVLLLLLLLYMNMDGILQSQ